MEEQIISFETAKLAKSKGFDIHCISGYTQSGEFTLDIGTQAHHCEYFAPTQDLLKKWLREKFNIEVEVYRTASSFDVRYVMPLYGCLGEIWDDRTVENSLFNIYEAKYEVALEKGLYLALESIK